MTDSLRITPRRITPRRITPRRRAVAGAFIAAAAVTTAGLAPVQAAPGPAAAVATIDPPWAGYKIKASKTAAGNFMGGRKVGDSIVYRIDPLAPKPSGAFGKTTRSSELAGAGARNTHRAAWVVAKYGDYRSNVQAAAVDAAVYHLLKGGAWRVRQAKGKARINQTPNPADVRRLANIMIRTSSKRAGPYQVAVTAEPVIKGQTLTVNMSVRSATGKPISKLPVTVSAGKLGTRTAATGDGGAAQVTFPAKKVGKINIRTRVRNLPPISVALRKPTKGSRVIIAGQKFSVLKKTSVRVRVQPTVKVQPRTSVKARAKFTPKLVVSGAIKKPTRAASIRLYGPFPTAAAANCNGTPKTADRKKIRGNGTFTFKPAISLRATGYYAWGITVPGNDWNATVDRCTDRLQVK